MGSPRMENNGMVDQSPAPQNGSPNLDVVDEKEKEPSDLVSPSSDDSKNPTGLSSDSFPMLRCWW